MINSVVWLIRFDKLQRLMKDDASTFYEYGEERIVISQTQDKRRIKVKPPLTDAEDLDPSTSFICVLLADIHQYVFLYENFKATAKRFREAERAVDTNDDKAKAKGKGKIDPRRAAHVFVKNQSKASALNYPTEDKLSVFGCRQQL